jgi:guanylate kinase
MSNTILTITGPSCTGKSTLENMLLATGQFEQVVSFTTRNKRAGEVHGKDYYFITEQEAELFEKEGMLAEHIKFSSGHYYGILGSELSNKTQYKNCTAVVEPNGVRQLRDYCLQNKLRHVAIYLGNPKPLLAARFLQRFQGDARALPLDYAVRMVNMLGQEQDWMYETRYDQIYTDFDSTSGNLVMESVLRLVNQ